jgi:hypothetical protein
MVRFKKVLWMFFIGWSALCAKALTLETPYDGIAGRNVFNLHPAVAAEPPPPKQLPLPKITLTGISTILGKQMAYITINGIKSGEAPQSLMMAEGQGGEGIRITSIDKQAGTVKVINGVEEQVLGFEPPKSSGDQPMKVQMSLPMNVPQVQPRTETPMSPEAQAALMEVQRVKFQQEKNPASQLLPPLN